MGRIRSRSCTLRVLTKRALFYSAFPFYKFLKHLGRVIYLRMLIIISFVFISIFVVACDEDNNHEEFDTIQGVIEDKRQNKYFQILLSSNDQFPQGVYFSIDKNMYENLSVGEQVIIEYNPRGILESNPPQINAHKVKEMIQNKEH